MKWVGRAAWVVPLLLAGVLWFCPPRGDDAYYHSVNAVEEVRAWREGAIVPRYHRAWNGGTGSFAPTIYSPIPMVIQGAAAWLAGDGQRAVGVSLVMAIVAVGGFLVLGSGRTETALVVVAPYLLAVVLTRATTTEAWALAGAAGVLTNGLPGKALTTRRGLGLAAAVALTAGSQVGMLIQLCWVLGAAWLAWYALHRRAGTRGERIWIFEPVMTFGWMTTGLLVAGWLWVPTLLDSRNLALDELIGGSFAWSGNFLPDGSELGVVLSVTACCLAAVVGLVAFRGEGEERWPPVAAAAAALFLTIGVSSPLWHLPGMDRLQFPWRFLGPATILLVIALGSLGGRCKWAAVALLVAPIVVVPVRVDSAAGHVPVGSSPGELARLVHEHWGLAPVLPSARGLYAPGFHRLRSLQDIERQSAAVVAVERSSSGGAWRVNGGSQTSVLLPLQWWPEWSITVNDREVPYDNRAGLVAIESGPEEAFVRAKLQPSRSRAVGGLVSLTGVLILAGVMWFTRRRR